MSRSVCTRQTAFDLQILKTQSNGPLYSSMVIGTLATDGWVVTFGTAWAGYSHAHSPPCCTKCNSPHINVPTSYHSMWHYNCLCTI